MTKEQTTHILNILDGSYKSFLMNREKKAVFEAWYEIMKNQEYEKVYTKLTDWVIRNNMPPAISDLVTIDWRKRYEQSS